MAHALPDISEFRSNARILHRAALRLASLAEGMDTGAVLDPDEGGYCLRQAELQVETILVRLRDARAARDRLIAASRAPAPLVDP